MTLKTLRTRAAQESGFALVVAMLVLLILTALALATVSASVSTSSSGTHDESNKAALEAAEAGLRAATYRLNMTSPEESKCLSGTSLASAESEHYCAGVTEQIGNGASFTYRMSEVLKEKEECAGEELKSTSTNIVQRCVTAEGIVNGVKVRTQERLAAYTSSESLFQVHGILGLEEMKVTGSVKIPGVAASNGLIDGEGSAAFEKGYELGPSGTFKPVAGKERNKSGVTVCGKGGMLSEPSCETTLSQPFVASLPTNHATASNNEDSRIQDKLDEVYENTKKAVSYEPTHHELTIGSEGRVTLSGAKYYFCNLKLEKAGKLVIAASAKVEIFVDSPEDKEACPSKTGKFEVLGNAKVENPSNEPTSLLIEMYGKGPFKIEGGATIAASVFVPEAEVTINGGTDFTGAVVGRKVHLENGSGIFRWSSEEEQFKAGNAGPPVYYRTAWTQCSPGTNPASGC